MELEYISMTNIRNFRNLDKFQLKGRGMVLVNGVNGVGKTTIPNVIRDVLFGAMNDGSTNDDLVINSRDAHILLSLYNNGHHYIVEKSRVKKKWKKAVVKDGVDITPHSQTNFYTELAKELNFTKEEWDASVHLSQRGSHVLVSGKPAARKEYVSEFFGVDGDFDTVKDAAEIELASVSKSIKEIEAYSTARATLNDELLQIVIPDVENENQRRVVIKSDIDSTIGTISELKEKQKLYNLFAQYKNSAYPENYGEEIDADFSLEHYRKLKSDAESLAKNYNQIKSYNENAAKNNIQFEELTKLVEGNSDYNIRFPENVEIYQKELNDLELKKSFSLERAKIQTAIDALKEYEGQAILETASRELELKSKTNEYAVLDHEYKQMAQGKCPTCGHEHDSSDITTKYESLVSLYSLVTDLTTSIAKDKEANRNIEELNTLKSKLLGIPEFSSIEQLRLDELKHVLPSLRMHVSKKQQLSSMKRQEYVDLPSQPPTSQEISNLEYSVNFFSDISKARKMCPKPSEVSNINIININTNVEELTAKNALLEEDIRKIDAILLNASEAQSRFNRISSQIKTIDEKFETLGKLKEAEFFWKTMVQAYGPKGIRVIQLQKIMDLITDVLPMYTSYMFEASRSYTFTSECDAGNIIIKVKRKHAEGEYEYDISTCSGGEAKKIAVCLILAVAKIRLARKSVNMVVLDEVDSQMDKTGRFQFTNELLPTIKEQFETVFVISHHDDTFQTAIYDEKLVFEQESADSHYTKITSTRYDQ